MKPISMNTPDLIRDGANAPVVYGDRCIHGGFNGDVFAFTLSTDVVGLVDGEPKRITQISGHLRVHLDAAIAVRDMLNKALEARAKNLAAAYGGSVKDYPKADITDAGG